MNNILSTALSGLQTATNSVNRAAHNIATAPTKAQTQDTLIEDIVDIKSATHAFKANLAVIRTTQDMQDTLLKALDTKA